MEPKLTLDVTKREVLLQEQLSRFGLIFPSTEPEIRKAKRVITKLIFIRGFAEILTYVLPPLAGFACIGFYNKYETNLDLGNVFFIITIFNLLVTPLRVFFFGLMNVIQAKVSLKRMSQVLVLPNQDEIPNIGHKQIANLPVGGVQFKDASFSYYTKEFDQIITDRLKSLGETKKKTKGTIKEQKEKQRIEGKYKTLNNLKK